jgi:hypothetical protein
MSICPYFRRQRDSFHAANNALQLLSAFATREKSLAAASPLSFVRKAVELLNPCLDV